MNNTNRTDVDNYKQFSDYALSIYKFMIGFLDKYGILTVDWVGYALGLNKEGRPISQQTTEELSESFRSLGEKLKQPEIRDAFIESIKEMEPVLKEAVFSLLNVALGAGEFVLKDMITFVCSDTPAAPVCGLFKFANNTIEFGEDILNTGRSSLNTINNLKDKSTKLIGKLQDAVQNAEHKLSSASQQMQKLPELPASPINQYNETIIPKGNSTTVAQTGGVKTLNKQMKERKKIETRVNKSLRQFLNIDKHHKTKKITSRKFHK